MPYLGIFWGTDPFQNINAVTYWNNTRCHGTIVDIIVKEKLPTRGPGSCIKRPQGLEAIIVGYLTNVE